MVQPHNLSSHGDVKFTTVTLLLLHWGFAGGEKLGSVAFTVAAAPVGSHTEQGLWALLYLSKGDVGASTQHLPIE